MSGIAKRVMKWLLFLIIGLFLFRLVSMIFLEKNSYAKYRNYRAEDRVDILILGSSHSDGGINVRQLEESLRKAGRTQEVFNYSIYGMRVEQMAFFMREILKDKRPGLIILETYSFLPIEDADREILARRAFDVFPLDRNKVEAVQYCAPDDYWSYYLPLIKYHSRWKELGPTDLEMVFGRRIWREAGKGDYLNSTAMEEMDTYFETDTSHITEEEELNSTEKECMERILDICASKEIKILLVSVPFKAQMGRDSLEQIRVNNYLVNHYVDEENVRMLDMNRMWDEMNFGYADLYNEGHCNESGARKVTACLAKYLVNYYDDTDRSGGQQ